MTDRYDFDDFVLERSQQRVRRRDGSEVDLSPRFFDALLLFIERAGDLLDRDTLMLALWPGVVVEDNNLSQVISGLRRALGDDHEPRRFIQTVPRRGFRFVAAVRAQDASRATMPPARNALAVLPFVPLAAGGRDELLEIGMADSLTTRLSGVAGLTLRSVASMRRFTGPQQDPMLAARALDVSWVLTGSLQRSGDRLRITARLLAAPAGTVAWSGTFDERIVDVFELQDVISARVTQALLPRLQLAPSPPVATRSPAARGTRDPDAYQLYLAARQHAQGVRADGLRSSIALYEKALAIDPGYAQAHAGMGETCRRMVFGADREPLDLFAHYRASVVRALDLAPDLPDAHAQLGWIHFWHDFDWAASERVFRHALALNPNEVGAQFGLGFLLLTLDRADEGIAHVRRARELDPMSLILNTMEASFLLSMGRREQARLRLARAFDIEPNFWVAHMVRAQLEAADGQPDAAIETLRRSQALSDQSTQPWAALGMALAGSGRRQEARDILHALQQRAQERYVPPTSRAALHAALGQPELALDALEQAIAVRDVRMAYLKDDPRWHTLHGEPRFAALLQRMDLHRFGPGHCAA